MSEVPPVELKDIWKRYGKQDVLAGINWTLYPGELVALMGINGAGKTTLLRTIAALTGQEHGSVRIAGEELKRDAVALRRELYFLGDEPALFPEMSAIQNIATMMGLWKVSPDRESNAAEWMDRFGVLHLRYKPVATLSRGQRYKVALAALAAIDPPIWLLDEPFASGMDAMGMKAFRQLVRQKVEQGRVVIYTTQMIEMVRDFAHRVTVISGGVMMHDGPVNGLEEAARAGNPYLEVLLDD
ncbi:MAG: ABC transporter ATP-binding protein [Verrucomicrobiota bacterium JB023]|nr:ABC transporter ATP-binding protein [Verrucomicrobiota bacterium JB023]